MASEITLSVTHDEVEAALTVLDSRVKSGEDRLKRFRQMYGQNVVGTDGYQVAADRLGQIIRFRDKLREANLAR